jgi:hypothetical protein
VQPQSLQSFYKIGIRLLSLSLVLLLLLLSTPTPFGQPLLVFSRTGRRIAPIQQGVEKVVKHRATTLHRFPPQ